MPIAKKQLKIGYTVIANPGGYVSKALVKDNGWEGDVTDGPDIEPGAADKDNLAPKGKAQKGS